MAWFQAAWKELKVWTRGLMGFSIYSFHVEKRWGLPENSPKEAGCPVHLWELHTILWVSAEPELKLRFPNFSPHDLCCRSQWSTLVRSGVQSCMWCGYETRASNLREAVTGRHLSTVPRPAELGIGGAPGYCQDFLCCQPSLRQTDPRSTQLLTAAARNSFLGPSLTSRSCSYNSVQFT